MRAWASAFLSALLVLACMPAPAADWVCTTSSVLRDEDGRNKGRQPAPRIGLLDVSDAVRGQVVTYGRSWLLIVMLPPDRQESRDAFASLGISPEAAWRIATTPPLRERTVVAVNTPDELVDKVARNAPAAGYVPYFSGGRTDVAPCF